jgi:hypothetical protein
MNELDVRELRERLSAVGQYVYEIRAPMTEGYRNAPLDVKVGLEGLERSLDDLDRKLAKIDGRGAVGGEVVLREERRR